MIRVPYVQLRTNKEISKETELAIKERLGRTITLLGKTEQWLMVECVSNCHMYFAGEEVDTAYVSVKLLGKSNDEAYNNFTGEVTNMLIELYATMAQAEIEKKEKRPQEGIQAKKNRGEWEEYGRPKAEKPSNWDEVIAQWNNGEITAVKAMELTGTKKTTFYKLLKE